MPAIFFDVHWPDGVTRVRRKHGFLCTSASRQPAQIERTAAEYVAADTAADEAKVLIKSPAGAAGSGR